MLHGALNSNRGIVILLDSVCAGGNVTRLESFSDAVFGFALTLLVVSLDVPKSFNDLVNTMRGFPAFAICFLLLALIWNGHYKFCRRYGLDDGFCPISDLRNALSGPVLCLSAEVSLSISASLDCFSAPDSLFPSTDRNSPMLLMIYGLGFAAVYLAMTLLYLHAWRLRDALELTELEKFDTRYIIRRLLTLCAVGLIAAGLAQVPAIRNWSPWIYALFFPILRISRIVHRGRRTKFLS